VTGYEIRVERAEPQQLAAIRATTAPARLGADIIGALDRIWPVLRAQGARTGHNVVIYYPAEPGVLEIDVGVQVTGDFAGEGAVRSVLTPGGEAATVAHFGEYSEMDGAYGALAQWCADNDRTRAGASWEVYGDWDDDPARRRTDLYYLLAPTG
jgi:effector-binding domain-containing protein